MGRKRVDGVGGGCCFNALACLLGRCLAASQLARGTRKLGWAGLHPSVRAVKNDDRDLLSGQAADADGAPE